MARWRSLPPVRFQALPSTRIRGRTPDHPWLHQPARDRRLPSWPCLTLRILFPSAAPSIGGILLASKKLKDLRSVYEQRKNRNRRGAERQINQSALECFTSRVLALGCRQRFGNK